MKKSTLPRNVLLVTPGMPTKLMGGSRGREEEGNPVTTRMVLSARECKSMARSPLPAARAPTPNACGDTRL